MTTFISSSLVIPEKHRFKHRDAIPGKVAPDNVPAPQLISPKFFNFLPSLQKLPLLFGFEAPKRPQHKPPTNHGSFATLQKPGKPGGIFTPPQAPQTRPEDALDFFNAGLDNFIQNPATLTQLPQPVNRSDGQMIFNIVRYEI